jgi:hypothetical protein
MHLRDSSPPITLARRVSRAAFRRVPNPNLLWHGLSAPGQNRLLMRIGDCSWMEMRHGHTWGEPGYPRLMAEALAGAGIGMRFVNHQVAIAANLPDLATLEHICGTSWPDAIVVELGAYYSTRALLEGKIVEPYELRTWFHWVSGPVGGALHRWLSRPLLRRYGHYRSPSAIDAGAGRDLEMFLRRLRCRYRGVPVAYLAPHKAVVDAAVDPERLREATDVLIAAACASGATVIDVAAELDEAARGGGRVFGDSGYDLCHTGHEIIAGRMLGWLREERLEHTRWTGKPSPETTRPSSVVTGSKQQGNAANVPVTSRRPPIALG